MRIAASVLVLELGEHEIRDHRHRGQDDLVGRGKNTDRQKSNPVAKKQAYWTWCQESERRLRS